MQYNTRNCRQFNHPEIYFNCDSVIPEVDANWLIAFLEHQVAQGIKYKVGETIAIGWMINTFQNGDNDQLILAEPDMVSMPITFKADITQTLKQFRSQNDICDSCGLSAEFPSLRTAIAVTANYENIANVFLARSEEEGNFSGWIFHDITNELSQNTNNHYLVSLYEFACKRPDLIKYLALPIDASVHIKEQDHIRIIANQQELPIKPNSFLAQLNQQR